MTGTTLTDRALLRISGEEARAFLQGLLTRDVLTLQPGHPRWTGLLTPQGKALFDFILWEDGGDVLIDCEASQADMLAKRLTLYRLRRKVTIAREEALAVHWSPDAADQPHDPRLPALGHRWLAPASPDAGEGDAAAAIENAVTKCLEDGICTADAGGTASTDDVKRAVCDRIATAG